MRGLLRTMVSTLLATAGVLYLLAAWERWWSRCSIGRFEELECLQFQDHMYSYMPPGAADPWIPVGNTAQLAGAATVAVAVAVLPWLWSPRAKVLSLIVSVLSLFVAMSGVTVWRAGASGAVVDLPVRCRRLAGSGSWSFRAYSSVRPCRTWTECRTEPFAGAPGSPC